MRAYITRRLLLIVPTLLLVTIIIFFSVRFIPGSVIDMMLAEMSEQAGLGTMELTAERLKSAMGLDVAIPHQYARWLGLWPQETGQFQGLIQGHLGDSLWKIEPVTSLNMDSN